ncbi:hypothetical protein GQ53DRAFT_421626 [Thozetella sp. PMI_491]|nr:hypothetical protein GQ53DRAFT_421626 [Thozetella sp. PMI_491]
MEASRRPWSTFRRARRESRQHLPADYGIKGREIPGLGFRHGNVGVASGFGFGGFVLSSDLQPSTSGHGYQKRTPPSRVRGTAPGQVTSNRSAGQALVSSPSLPTVKGAIAKPSDKPGYTYAERGKTRQRLGLGTCQSDEHDLHACGHHLLPCL